MRRIVVLGGGESGVGAAVLAKVKGFDVFLSDNGTIADHFVDDLRKWDIPFEQGGHTEGLILSADEVVKSPGIPSTVPMVRKLEAQGTPILSTERPPPLPLFTTCSRTRGSTWDWAATSEKATPSR